MKKNFLVMLALLVSLSFSTFALQNELEYLTALLTELEDRLRQAERPLPSIPEEEFTPPFPQTEQRTKPRPKSEYGRKPLEEPTESPIETIKKRALERQAREEKRKSMSGIPVPGIEKGKEKEPEKPSEIAGYRPPLRRVQSQKFERPVLVPEVPTKKVTFVGFGNEVEQLKSLPNTTPEEKLTKKYTAKALNDGINQLVTQKQQDAVKNRAKLQNAMKAILEIDPLLIQTSLDTMRKAGASTTDLYRLMTDLYDNRIRFLENEFKKIKPGFKLTKGIRDDIDEGLAYPIEISGEVQDAEIKAAKDDDNARIFFNNVNDLWERLLKLLRGLSREQKKTLKAEGISVKQYIKDIKQQKSRTYCKYQTKEGCLPYKSLYQELDDMVNTINLYEEHKNTYSRTQKTFAIQNIINKLKAFLAYATDKEFCQICLNMDAKDSIGFPEKITKYKQQLETLKRFFKQLSIEDPKKYQIILATLGNLIKTEDTRRYFMEKYRNPNDAAARMTDPDWDWNVAYEKYKGEIEEFKRDNRI